MGVVAVCDSDEAQLRTSGEVVRCYAEECGASLQIKLFLEPEECIDAAPELDVVFVDVEFDGEPLGIDIARRINEIAPDCKVIYLTNNLFRTLDVYQTDHVWYVLKSQLAERLPGIAQKLTLLNEERHTSIVVSTKDDGRVVNIPCVSIMFLERRERITHIVTQGAAFVVREKLPEMLERLPQARFVRCHNSFIVNLSYVSEIHAADLELDDGSRVPISRRYSKQFRKRYSAWAKDWSV